MVCAFNHDTMHNASERPDPENQDPRSDRRITISAARKMLGMLALNYSDADMVEIIDVLYGVAEEGYELHQDIGCPSDQEE